MIRLDSISKRHGGQILFLEACMGVCKADKVGLVGPNGAGKSTVFRMIAKEEQPDGGSVAIDRGVTIGHFSQDIGEMTGRSVVAETMAGAGEVSVAADELHRLEQAMADPPGPDPDLDETSPAPPGGGHDLMALIERFGHAQARFDELGGYALEAKAREILAGLGFHEANAAGAKARGPSMDADVGTLSGGWKMRVGLARILLMNPDALLLDEPTNHLDLESILWLESFLKQYPGALVMTSHDRAFLNRVVTRIVDIDGGDLIAYSGNYDFYLEQRAIAAAQQEAQYARQQAMLAKEEAFIARFKARASHAAQVQSRVKKLDKIERVEPPKRRVARQFEFRPAPRSGEDVAKLERVNKAYGGRTIYDGLDFLVRRGERWCVLGTNGAGKSTLLKLVAGQIDPDEGTVTVGTSTKLGYFAQHAMELLDPDATVIDTLRASFPLATMGSMKALAGAFGFSGDEADKRCRVLSGGEKARVVLAMMLYDPPNFLVLDEPTNHLDMETKEMLTKALASFGGTMLFVSHDRRFLADVSNRVLEVSDDGVRIYGGGYTEYVEQSGREAPGGR